MIRLQLRRQKSQPSGGGNGRHSAHSSSVRVYKDSYWGSKDFQSPCLPRHQAFLLAASQGQEQGALRVTHLKGASLKQGDLVMLRKITEAGDMLGKLYHLPHSGCEAHGEIFPDLLDSSPTASVRVHVHWTCLEERNLGKEVSIRLVQMGSPSRSRPYTLPE